VLAAEVVTGLRQCRSLRGIPLVDDAELEYVQRAVRLEAYDPALTVLGRVIAGLDTRLHEHNSGRSIPVARYREALVDLHELRHQVEELRFRRLLTLLSRVRTSLQRLRSPETTRQTLELICDEASVSCDLTRVVRWGVDSNMLQVRGLHWTHDQDLMERWCAVATARPPMLDPRDREIQLLRRRIPILVRPEDAVGMREMVEVSQTLGYVAAPLVLDGSVIGTISGDRHLTGQRVDTLNRDLLATFSEGVAGILERTVLLDRVQRHSRQLRELLAESESTLDELVYTGGELRLDEHGELQAVAPAPDAIARADSKLVGLLTPRELEVIELIAAGASNPEIAAQLVISETTAKSHVKQILRKMRASNRAQAASRYVRLKSMPVD
jgi:DNA-binding CsgD family transcriptional regulator